MTQLYVKLTVGNEHILNNRHYNDLIWGFLSVCFLLFCEHILSKMEAE